MDVDAINSFASYRRKEQNKEGKGDGTSKGKSMGPKSAKGSCKGKTSKCGLSGLENPKAKSSQEAQRRITLTMLGLTMDGVVTSGKMTVVHLVGTKVLCQFRRLILSLGRFDHGAVSSPKRFT